MTQKRQSRDLVIISLSVCLSVWAHPVQSFNSRVRCCNATMAPRSKCK